MPSADTHGVSVGNNYSDLVTMHWMKENGGCIVAYHRAHSVKPFIL